MNFQFPKDGTHNRSVKVYAKGSVRAYSADLRAAT